MRLEAEGGNRRRTVGRPSDYGAGLRVERMGVELEGKHWAAELRVQQRVGTRVLGLEVFTW